MKKLLLVLSLFAVPAAHAQLERTDVHIAVGGKSALYYLPLVLTERLNYFKDEGLNVRISDFPGGTRSLEAVVGGSADVVAGAYEHTINMQSRRQNFQAFVLAGAAPQITVAISSKLADRYKSPKDLKGLKIGVTAPGSSTHFMVLYMMTQAGLKPDDASFIGTGSGNTVVAAVKRGEVDAISNADPMINILDRDGAVKIVADTRTLEGTKAVYGGPYPAAVLYASTAYIEKNPNTVQALVSAFVRGLKWVQSHSPEEIAKVMPEEYALGDKAIFIQSIKTNMPAYSPDGRFTREAAETAYKVLKAFDPNVQGATIDLAKTYMDKFVDKANAGN
jgi:NitT/TauT family transport system substrate-binding protein